MDLGMFSVSLAVDNLAVSRDFYMKLGFEVVPGEDFESGGDVLGYNDKWVILEHESVRIGLFQKMFDKNTLTFHPTDVRAVQKALKTQGVELISEADETTTGPASAFLFDPDGNPILLDQHNP